MKKQATAKEKNNNKYTSYNLERAKVKREW
jgi:hypothetical protein